MQTPVSSARECRRSHSCSHVPGVAVVSPAQPSAAGELSPPHCSGALPPLPASCIFNPGLLEPCAPAAGAA